MNIHGIQGMNIQGIQGMNKLKYQTVMNHEHTSSVKFLRLID